MRIVLIRHPQPDVPEGTCYGQSDPGLRHCPQVQAAELQAHLKSRLSTSWPADVPVYSSPLRRCRELATALHPAPAIDERLQEMHFGSWEMQLWSAIPRHEIDAWVANPLGYAPPGGETVAAVQARVLEFMRELQARHDEAVLVTHAGVMKVLHGLQGRLPPAQWLPMTFPFGEPVWLEWDIPLQSTPVQPT